MKKIISLLLFIFLTLPYNTKAYFALVTANINIIVNTVGGDNSFNVHITTTDSNPVNVGNFTIQTSRATGSVNTSVIAFTNTDYYISQDLQPNWNLVSEGCTGSSSANTGIIISNGLIKFTATPWANITCTFTNQKAAPTNTPVLIVPGLLGTELYKGTEELWADIPRMANPFNTDSFMDPLQFNANLTPLDNSILVGAVIKNKPFYDYTDGLINEFKNQGYTEGVDLFTFPYDWRYGVSEDIVNQLKGQINYILNQTQAGQNAGKINIVAHSTGGLIVKKYIQEHTTDNHVQKVVFVGVPNIGAPKALKAIINGDNFGVPGLNSEEMKKIAQNLPITYDLAPSQQYYNSVGSVLKVKNSYVSLIGPDKNLDYSQTSQELENENLVNNQAMANSGMLHSLDFDNYDVRNAGVDDYNIIGCKTATFGKFTEIQQGSNTSVFDFPEDTSGDGTVPLVSAQTIPTDVNHVYFAPKSDHGKMPSQDGIRQQIVNIITGSNLDTHGKILTHDQVQQDPALCEIKGESINIKSPVAISATDQDGNISGIAADGSIQNDIPGADYQVWGEHKYVFLPTDNGQQYNITLAGTGNGTFTVDDQAIEGDAITQTQVFSNLPVTPALSGQVTLGTSGSSDSLSLQVSPSSSITTVLPSSIINANQSEDTTAPSTTPILSGPMGQLGFYKGNVTVALNAIDPVVNNDPTQTSGILKTQYNLDDTGYQTYSPSTPLIVTAEGVHSLKYFSTDNAGNNEQEQIIVFTVDTTPPEITLQFNPSTKDLQFTATDTLPTTVIATTSTSTILFAKNFISNMAVVKIVDQDSVITASDAAGNITQIVLQGKNRKQTLKADIASLTYNCIQQDMSKNLLHFDWLYDKKQNLQLLTQQVQSKRNYNIAGIYGLGYTVIMGKDQAGKVNKILRGLDLLKVSTNKGDLLWSY